jgi:hypothetical protein
MKALSLEPPGRSGDARGRGSAELVAVCEDEIEEGGGERVKPPVYIGENDIESYTDRVMVVRTWRLSFGTSYSGQVQ